MDTSVIKSYLVALNFDVNSQSQRKFDEAIRVATQNITRFTGGMATSFVEAGASVVGVLTAIATGTVALATETARGDLQMQLMARRMMMSLPQFREMKMALDALGVSAQDVIFGPPELRERYKTLSEDNRRIMAALGPADFEREMRRIRDVEFQFTRLRQEAGLFVMALTKSLSKALTGDENGILMRLKSWNEWLIQNIPDLANKAATYLAPVLRDVWSILKDIGSMGQMVADDFVQMVGVLYNDQRLIGGKANLETISLSLQHISDELADIIDETREWFALLHQPAGQTGSDKWLWGPVGKPATMGDMFARMFPESGMKSESMEKYKAQLPIFQQRGKTLPQQAMAAAMSIGADLGVNPRLIFEQWAHETGGFTSRLAREQLNLGGMKTVTGAYREFSSVDEFAQAYERLISRGRFSGLRTAQTEQEWAQALKAGHYMEDTPQNYARGMEHARALAETINVNIYAQTSDPAEHARKFIEETNRLKSQRQQVQSGQVYVTGGY